MIIELDIKRKSSRCFEHQKGSASFSTTSIVLVLIVAILPGYRRLRDIDYFKNDTGRVTSETQYVVRTGKRRELASSKGALFEQLLSPDLGGSFETLLSEFKPGAELPDYQQRDAEEAGCIVSVYPCIRVSVYPCIRVSVYPCIRVSVYPCIRNFRAGYQ